MAENTNAMVNSPMAASNTLWHQRAVRLSMINLLKFMAAQFQQLRIQCAHYEGRTLRFSVTSGERSS
jgi:hypothetical protein